MRATKMRVSTCYCGDSRDAVDGTTDRAHRSPSDSNDCTGPSEFWRSYSESYSNASRAPLTRPSLARFVRRSVNGEAALR